MSVTTKLKTQTIKLRDHQISILLSDAQAASLGGASSVRSPSDRNELLWTDQLVGLAGNMALCLWRDGDLRSYSDMRWWQNNNRYSGDGGCDLPRCRFDIKTSLMRSSRDPADYRLAVRPRERHKSQVYGLALIPRSNIDDLTNGIDVILVGWCEDSDFYEHPESFGTFSGAYTLMSHELNPFPPMRYCR